MPFEIKSDYQHQEFYRKVLDELEDRFLKSREAYLNTNWNHSSVIAKARAFDRSAINYYRVKKRYERERFTRRWKH